MFYFEDIKYKDFNLKFYKSDLIQAGVDFLFTTRVGGDTPEPLDRFTLHAKDAPEYNNFAEKNRKILCNITNCDYEKLVVPNQQHTDNIFILKKPQDIDNLGQTACDGIITNLVNLPVMLVYADCIPVFLYDEKTKTMALIHAGWKGTAKSIVKKAVNLMTINFDVDYKDIRAVIGAGICRDCFEVSPDVVRQLGMTIKNACDTIFIKEKKLYADLKKINYYQLLECDIENIDVSDRCTSCNNDLFYSYRADNKKTGRHAMFAVLKEK